MDHGSYHQLTILHMKHHTISHYISKQLHCDKTGPCKVITRSFKSTGWGTSLRLLRITAGMILSLHVCMKLPWSFMNHWFHRILLSCQARATTAWLVPNCLMARLLVRSKQNEGQRKGMYSNPNHPVSLIFSRYRCRLLRRFWPPPHRSPYPGQNSQPTKHLVKT